MAGTWILSDAHTHLGTRAEMEERKENGILSLLCASRPEEAEILFTYEENHIIPTCGVHPWYAGTDSLGDMIKWMERCPVVGEIGMDSVWCRIPLKVQEEVFRQQLRLACQWNKPVILHTKGQEKEIAAIIREYPNRYLIHWYSCEYGLEEYLAMDCYFSIGPDVKWNPAVRRVAEKVPLNRLLIETDGLESVRWACEEWGKPEMDQERKDFGKGVASALEGILEAVAQSRGMTPEDGGRVFRDNLTVGFLQQFIE